MGILDATHLAPTSREAAEKMEALLLQRMLASAHPFGESKAPGAALRQDLFLEALAEAVAKAGGLGLAKDLTPQDPGKTGATKKVTAGLNESERRVETGEESLRDPRRL